jgi:hypothetical protein
LLTASGLPKRTTPLEPSITTSTAGLSRCEPGTGLFVWTIWVAMLAVGVLYVIRFGPDVPRWDDYAVIPQLTGAQPVTLAWLWSQHNEHRIPLARLILLGTFRLSGADPRPVMLLIVGMLAGLAAVLIRGARRCRGGYHHADAFLPIALLNLGHHENLLWSIQITYVLAVVLLGIVLALVVRSRDIPGLGSLAVAAACVGLMPLCNAGGLTFIPALSLWFWSLAAGVLFTTGRGGRGRALRIVALSLPALVLMVLYLRGYSAPKHHAAPGGTWAALRTTVQFLGMSLGEPGASLWPGSGLVVVALLLGSVGVLARAWFRAPGERARIEGMACVLAAVVSLALGSGWGRSGEDVLAGLQPRYTTLATPALLVVYFSFAGYGHRVSRNVVPMALFTAACILLWPNTERGWAAGRSAHAEAEAFDRDLATGTPLFRLVRRYTPFLHPSQQGLHEALTLLHQGGIDKFRSLQEDPAFQELAVNLAPADVRLARWNDGRVEVTGIDPWVRFDLTAPVFVSGIRMRYSHAAIDGSPAHFRLAWRRPGQRDFPAEQQYGNWGLPTGPDRTTTVWVDDQVAQIRIQPDNRPCEFTIAELTLLIAPHPDMKRP